MKRWLPVIVVSGLTLELITGCCHRKSAIVSQQYPPATMPVCPPSVTPGVPVPVVPPGGQVPPPPAPPPGIGSTSPPGVGSTPPPPPAFPNTPPNSSYFGPTPAEDNWRPIEGRQLAPATQPPSNSYPTYPPVAPPEEPSRQLPLNRIQLAPPEPIHDKQPPPPAPIEPSPEPPMATAPQAQPETPAPNTLPGTAEPPPVGANERPRGFSFPVGIAQFSVIKDGMANGLRPSLDEGLDWLQKQGYRTIVYVHRPGDPDSADRNQVEKRGMRFIPMEVSAETLNHNHADFFIRTVTAGTNQPVFVYDRDGSLAGGLWYLYFRRVENSSEDVARVRAGSLGFREDRDDAHREMWQAVQKLANE